MKNKYSKKYTSLLFILLQIIFSVQSKIGIKDFLPHFMADDALGVAVHTKLKVKESN